MGRSDEFTFGYAKFKVPMKHLSLYGNTYGPRTPKIVLETVYHQHVGSAGRQTSRHNHTGKVKG